MEKTRRTEMTERILETKTVKEALKEAGIDCKVKHGKGTSYAWLYIFIDRNTDHDTVLNIAQKATGRHGEYDGGINVFRDLD